MPAAVQTLPPCWDYRGADTKEYTHCYHNYPAMMIPQIARRLIEEYGARASSLLDPYCGTGTSLVEASMKGMDVHGCDLNPMARLIAETKTLRIEPQVLELYLKEYNNHIFSLNFGRAKILPAAPAFDNIEFWFKPKTVDKLAALKQFVSGIREESVRKFFLVAFSETVRECSLTRNCEFKLYRMPERQREGFDPDVYAVMTAKLARNHLGLLGYLERVKGKKFKVRVHALNSSESMGEMREKSVGMVVTSPPYGDSKTTVAYGQFSRLSNQWMGVADAARIDNQLMGGKPRQVEKTGISCLDNAVKKIMAVDEKRAAEVFGFYVDYRNSIRHVAATIKRGGYACYVVGNRTVKNTVLATDNITRRFFEEQGFRHEGTFIRNIPNKRMPNKNSPTNIVGKTAQTINKEHIVIMRRR